MKLRIAMALVLASGLAGTALANGDIGPEAFDAWDSDGSGGLSADEFGSGLFSFLDGDGDGRLSGDERARGSGVDCGALGTNYAHRDQFVDKHQFQVSMLEGDCMSQHDSNADSNLDREEFAGFRGKWGRPRKGG
ncbi:MAG: hypothetical protein Kilf2KO_13600 [Rhodospirillales bacterium]